MPDLQLTPWLLLIVGAGSAALTANALRPLKVNPVVLVASFFSSWLTNELVVHQIWLQLAVATALVYAGALSAWPGWLGLLLMVTSLAGMVSLWWTGRKSRAGMRRALQQELDAPDLKRWPKVPVSRLALPFAFSRRSAHKVRHVKFWSEGEDSLHLDVTMPRGPVEGRRPAVLQLHGGAWVIGDKREQGLPLLWHLAEHGWVGFNANYRLSPGAAFPDHLVDVKRAIAWIREHADEYGVDPDFIAVTGGSAGGHLAALAALTPGDPRYQPGFEGADTRVQAAVPIYAVYDMTDRLRIMGRPFVHTLLARYVFKRPFVGHEDLYADASPIDQVRPDAPPFLVVHGDKDTLAPVEYARLFVERLSALSDNPVVYVEVEGAQHAFDVFHSPRTVGVVEGVERFLEAQRSAQMGDAPERRS